MRKLVTLTLAALAAAALTGGTAFAGVPTKSPPVSLQGKVTNKGEKTVKKGKVTIEQDDFYFKPTFPKSKQGSTVTVSLKNEGKTQHTFTIDALGIDTVLDAGKKAAVQVTLPTNGALPFYCRFHGPTGSNQGMQGAFFSKKGEALSTSAAGAAGATPSSGAPTTTGAPSTTSGSSGGGSGY